MQMMKPKQGKVYLYTVNGLTTEVRLVRQFMSKPEYWYAETPFGTFVVSVEQLKEKENDRNME